MRSCAAALVSPSRSFGARSSDARALEGAVDGRDRGLEHRGDVADPEVEHVVEDEGRTLSRREHLHGAHEREPDALVEAQGLLRARGRRQERVGVGLEPGDVLAHRGHRWAGRNGRPDVLGEHAPLPLPEHVEARVRRDAVHPRAEGRRRLVRSEMPPRLEARLLERVLGVLVAAEHAVRVHRELAGQGLDEPTERGLASALRGVDERLFGFFERDR